MATALYATRSDLLSAVSLDSQAKQTNDPSRRWNIGVGDGVTRRWVTPFIETTTFTGYVNGLAVTPSPSVSTGSGSSSRDEAVFSAAPSLNAVVAVTADKDAINADIVDRALLAGAEMINTYLHAILPVTDPNLLGVLRDKNVLFARVRLRGRRNLDVVDPVEMEYRTAVRWLEGVAKGDIVLWTGQGAPEDEAEALSGSEPPVFGPPNDPMGDW